MRRKIIVYTSPLFYLHRLECLDIFQKLYREIVVPEAVVMELNIGRKVGEDVPQLGKYKWIKIEKVGIPGFIKLISDLGPGEAEVLALGCESENSLVVIDDLLARKIARLQELRFTGTAGLLLKAKKEEHIPEIAPLLRRLEAMGFYLSNTLIDEILKISEEGSD